MLLFKLLKRLQSKDLNKISTEVWVNVKNLKSKIIDWEPKKPEEIKLFNNLLKTLKLKK